MIRALWGLLLACTALHSAHAQQCGAGSFDAFAAYDGVSSATSTVANNVIIIGNSRLQLSTQNFGNGNLSTDQIDGEHYPGEPGMVFGHSSTATSLSNRIEFTLDFRNPANTSQFLPVTDLRFRLHDIDAGDNIVVNAYDQNGTLINLTGSNYSFDNTSGPSIVSYNGGNRFSATASSPDNSRLGTVNLNFTGRQVRRVVFQYYDPTSSGTFTIAQMASCNAAITLNKTTLGGTGGPFGFALTNTTRTSATVTTTAAATPTQVDGNATAGMQPFSISSAGSAVTINENSPATGWTLMGATCTNAAGTTVGSRSGSVYTLPGSATGVGAALTCTFTNARLATLRINKTLPNGRVVASDQFSLNLAGEGAPAAVVTTGTGSTATGTLQLTTAVAGTVYTLSETAAGGANLANYITSYSCTNARAGGQTPSGSATSFTLTPVLNDDLTCTFANGRPLGLLALAKTASPSPAAAGAVVTYTLTASNPVGAPAVANAVLRDAPQAGLDCAAAGLAAPTCTSLSGGAQCPGSVTAAALLSGGGVTLPSLPAGSSLAVTLQCRVTASGQ